MIFCLDYNDKIMKKHSIKLFAVITTATLVALPLIAGAETKQERRIGNIEANRDVRNVMMAQRSSTTPVSYGAKLEDSNRSMIRVPMWLNATSSPWNEKRLGTSTRPFPVMAKVASTSKERGEDRKEKNVRLEQFAAQHLNLMRQLDQSLKVLKEMRTKVATRIETAEKAGRTMTEARAKLAMADEKIKLAEAAIQTVAAYIPPAITASIKTVATSTQIAIEKPREVGKKAIDALKTAKEALTETVKAIAQNMGLKNGQDSDSERNGSTTPRRSDKATTTTR